MNRTLCAFIFFMLLITGHAFGQISVDKQFKTLPLGKDTLCFRYSFNVGDTLAYVVESMDTVDMPPQQLLTKTRTELVLVFCDSVHGNNFYRLRYRLQTAKEMQRTDKDSTQRNGSPWVGREVIVDIDTLGNRILTGVDDPQKVSVAPGGAFQPLLLPTLGQSCGRQNESWIVEDTARLVENGSPGATFDHKTLWRVVDNADTLGRRFAQLQYTQTALGWLRVQSKDMNLQLDAKIAAFGKMSFDSQWKVPYHVFASSENRISVLSADGRVSSGKHRVTLHAQLVELRSSDPTRVFRFRRAP